MNPINWIRQAWTWLSKPGPRLKDHEALREEKADWRDFAVQYTAFADDGGPPSVFWSNSLEEAQMESLRFRLERLKRRYEKARKAKKKSSHILAQMQEVRHQIMRLEAGK